VQLFQGPKATTVPHKAEQDRMIQCGSWAKDEHCCAVACYTAGTSAQEEGRWLLESIDELTLAESGCVMDGKAVGRKAVPCKL
jgi:hypothetical protein